MEVYRFNVSSRRLRAVTGLWVFTCLPLIFGSEAKSHQVFTDYDSSAYNFSATGTTPLYANINYSLFRDTAITSEGTFYSIYSDYSKASLYSFEYLNLAASDCALGFFRTYTVTSLLAENASAVRVGLMISTEVYRLFKALNKFTYQTQIPSLLPTTSNPIRSILYFLLVTLHISFFGATGTMLFYRHWCPKSPKKGLGLHYVSKMSILRIVQRLRVLPV